MRKIYIMDTSVLCVYLQIPNMDKCTGDIFWDYSMIKQKIDSITKDKHYIVLPLATIIETGNHIAHINGDKYKLIQEFLVILKAILAANSPWAAFTEHEIIKQHLTMLSEGWKDLAVQGVSFGDAMIKEIADYYHQEQYTVEILTGDNGLKSTEPAPINSSLDGSLIPRRHRK